MPASTACSSSASRRPASTVAPAAPPAPPSARTCASTPRPPRPNRPDSAPASAADPTPPRARRSGTCGPTSWPGPCGSSGTAWSTARAWTGWPATSATASASSTAVITAEVGTGPLAIAAGPARPGGAHPPRDDDAARRPRGLRRRVLQRPPVQRDRAADLRRHAPGAAGPRHQGGAAEPHGGADGCRDPRCAIAPARAAARSAPSRCWASSAAGPCPGSRRVTAPPTGGACAFPTVTPSSPSPPPTTGTTGRPSSTPTSTSPTCAT